MKKIFLVMICILVISPLAQANQDRPLANAGKSGLYARSIDQVLRLSEYEIDLATAALIISENWSDLVPGRRHLAELDDMALEIRDRLDSKGLKADYRAIPVINEYLFDELGFESISEASDPNDLFLHTVLDKKRGYCLSLSILYLSLAERLGLSLYGVVVPGHFFVRYDDGQVRFNIETTSKGGVAPDKHYINKFKVPKGNSGIYMKNLDKIQTLGCFFNNLGNSYSDIGDKASALRALETAVEINPLLPEARSNLGNIYLEMNQLQDAIYQYEAALEINPGDAKTHNNLGNAYVEQDRLSYAVSQYRQSIRLDPNYIDAYTNLALAYCKQQRFSHAITELKKALRLEPKNASLYSQLGDVYSQTDHYKSAILQYENALKINNNSAKTHFGLAVCYGKLGFTDDEIKAYKTALAIEPDMLAALVNLGNTYFNMQNYDAAIEQYTKAVQVKPDEGTIYYNLGSSYSNKEMYEQAVAAYLKAVEIDPKTGDAHYGLAFGYYNLKNYEAALKHIKIAKKLGVKVTEDQINTIKSHLK
jgi:tetratricopeptide (TPR) repeat protein